VSRAGPAGVDPLGTITAVSDTRPVRPLSPTQLATLELLRRTEPPVVFDAGLVDDLVTTVTESIEAFGDRLDGGELFVTKDKLNRVFGCETHAVTPDTFAWNPANAVGQVAHKAIQLLLAWRGEPTPLDLVDESLARLADDDRSIGVYIAGLSPGDEAELRGRAADKVTKFLECFPPLDRRAAPVTESSTRWPLEGPVILAGKADLVIGRPEGAESRKVIVDLKTGWVSPRHRDDLRYYALIETLRHKVPPRKLASFYLDAGEPHVEDVTEAVLRSAVRRMLDGVNLLVELTSEGRPPTKQPGVHCRWCPLRETCEEGRAHLAGRDAAVTDGDD
jgi:CRISPR/Cas system-associated exonuclease Cas4 (RecB family)